MSTRRDIRRLAMQALYQLDLRGEADGPAIAELLGESDPVEAASELTPDIRQAAFALAQGAWTDAAKADALALELAPDWPAYRQPPVDRAILRLCYHEMASGYSPVKVAINEAVELAKEYGGENSAPFLNGVLDKIAKRLPQNQE